MENITKAAGDLALIDSAAHYGRDMSTLTLNQYQQSSDYHNIGDDENDDVDKDD